MSNFDKHLLEELKDPEIAAEFILDALEEPGDKFSYLMKAISQVAKAHRLSHLVEATDLGKSSVHKMIQEDSNPTLKNVMKIFRAMGLRISIDVDEDKAANVLDVAQYIMNNSRRAKNETTWWLQKLAYFANVESLLNYGKVLFQQDIEAWANGPVVRDLFEAHRGLYSLSNVSKIGDESNLSKREKLAIDWAIDKYGGSTGRVLSELTHSQEPWIRARGDLPDGAFCSHVISSEAIKEYHQNIPDYDKHMDEPNHP